MEGKIRHNFQFSKLDFTYIDRYLDKYVATE